MRRRHDAAARALVPAASALEPALAPLRNFVTYQNVEINLATAGMTARYTKPLSF
jgi:hypothetical protein